MPPKKKITGLIKLQINAGAATPAPPIGPALGQHGVNIMEFCKAYNPATESQRGNVIPVEITVYEDRSFTFVTKTPPAAELIKKAAGVAKGSATPHTVKVATLTKAQVRDIATQKLVDLNANDVEAAEKIARAEDNAIFNGYRDAGITGIIEASPHAPLEIPADPLHYPHVIVQAKELLREAGINGPFALAAGPKVYNEISQGAEDGYPIRKRIEQQIIDGPIIWAPSIDGAVLLSTRGGDFELTVGQDLSIGYAFHERHTVELYLTESFTFRVLEPAAEIFIRHQAAPLD